MNDGVLWAEGTIGFVTFDFATPHCPCPELPLPLDELTKS